MRIPRIKSLDTALYIYYAYPEIGTYEMKMLFNKISNSTIFRLKNLVRERMLEERVPSHGLYSINTKIAFEVWGLDIEDLEARRAKLQELGFDK